MEIIQQRDSDGMNLLQRTAGLNTYQIFFALLDLFKTDLSNENFESFLIDVDQKGRNILESRHGTQ